VGGAALSGVGDRTPFATARGTAETRTFLARSAALFARGQQEMSGALLAGVGVLSVSASRRAFDRFEPWQQWPPPECIWHDSAESADGEVSAGAASAIWQPIRHPAPASQSTIAKAVSRCTTAQGLNGVPDIGAVIHPPSVTSTERVTTAGVIKHASGPCP